MLTEIKVCLSVEVRVAKFKSLLLIFLRCFKFMCEEQSMSCFRVWHVLEELKFALLYLQTILVPSLAFLLDLLGNSDFRLGRFII